MRLPPERPISLALSFALIRAATLIVPAREQGQFEYDWQQKLFHRWQFLRQTGLWNFKEEWKLLLGSLPALRDAVQHFGAQEEVQTRVSRVIQSPLSCLGVLAALFLLVAVSSGGFPATRALFFQPVDSGTSRLVFVWAHSLRGGADRPLPSDAVGAWKAHSQLISGAVAFRAVHKEVKISNGPSIRPLVIITEPDFFDIAGIHPHIWAAPGTPSDYVLLSYNAWMEQFHASPRMQEKTVTIEGKSYPVRGILPAGFEPLSRQPALYLVQRKYAEKDAYAMVRVNGGVSKAALSKEFLEITQNFTIFFLNGQLRYGFAQSSMWAPARSFGFAVLASTLMLFLVFRLHRRPSWPPQARQRTAFLRRTGFFLAKTSLGLVCVFTACLEWSRSSSAILFGNFDPASGPFLLWLYILGTMGVLFAAVVDQKARCRECLQLLAFPVRMGSPGTMLLDWSGTEICCTQGHGVLHVPHWADESEHWIALDDSWQGIFGNDKP